MFWFKSHLSLLYLLNLFLVHNSVFSFLSVYQSVECVAVAAIYRPEIALRLYLSDTIVYLVSGIGLNRCGDTHAQHRMSMDLNFSAPSFDPSRLGFPASFAAS